MPEGIPDSFSGKFHQQEQINNLHLRVLTLEEEEAAGGGTVGPQGPQGPAGPTGATGPEGPQGPVGPQGPIGATGPAGADSTVPGPQGPAGAEGPVGPAGADSTVPGPQGPQGPAGETGLTGPQGPVGPEGPEGPVGPEGPQGIQGEPGTGGGSGVYAATPDTLPVRGAAGELLGKMNPSLIPPDAYDMLVNLGYIVEREAMTIPVVVPASKFSVTLPATGITSPALSSSAFTAIKVSQGSSQRFVQAADITFNVTAAVNTLNTALFRITALSGSGFHTVLPSGLAISSTGVVVPVRLWYAASGAVSVLNLAPLPTGNYTLLLNPGVYGWSILPAA